MVANNKVIMENRKKQVIALRSTNNWSDDFYSQELSLVNQLTDRTEKDAWALYTSMVARND